MFEIKVRSRLRKRWFHILWVGGGGGHGAGGLDGDGVRLSLSGIHTFSVSDLRTYAGVGYLW